MPINYNNLYLTYQPKLKTLISKQIKDQDYVEDLVQEVLLKVHRHLDKYDDKYSLSTWIYTIAFNTVKSYYKSLSDLVTYSDEPSKELTQDNPESIMIAAETEDLYLKSLSQLDSTYLDAYIMREVDGMSMKDISSQLNIPENTVKSRLKRARDYIKKEIL